MSGVLLSVTLLTFPGLDGDNLEHADAKIITNYIFYWTDYEEGL